MADAKPRFFLGMIDICGVYRSLELALREAGYDAYFLNMGREHRALTRREPLIPRLYIFLRKHVLTNEYRDSKLPAVLEHAIGRVATSILLLWICVKFDVIMLKSGLGMTQSCRDLAWLRRRGKIIVCSFHGSDSRPSYLTPISNKTASSIYSIGAQRKKRLIERGQYADYIIDSPASAHWQPKDCCIRQVIFSPAPLFAFPDAPERAPNGGPLRVLHCPNDPQLKGTAIIRREIERLIEDGHSIDYVEIQGESNERVIRELQKADLVVDELYSDNYGGILALEALTAGVPVIVCGFAKKSLDQTVPDWARVPTHYCRPQDLGHMICKLVEDPEFRRKSSRISRAFAREILGPKAVAERLARLVEGRAPADWFFDPAMIRYSCGAAGPCEEVHVSIRAVLDVYGAEGLLLDDKPALRDFIVQQALHC